MMIKTIMACAVIGMLSCAVQAQTTQPAAVAVPVTVGQLELRVNVEMSRGDYAAALPLLEKISQEASASPDELGPVMEQIRICQRQMAAGASPKTATTQPVVDAFMETRKPHAPPLPGQTVEMEIKQLGNFAYDASIGGNIPQDVKQLDGCHFRTRGFMIALEQTDDVSQFALVPTLGICCSKSPPQVQHTIMVKLPEGKSTAFDPDQIIVEGTLHVREQRDGGFIVSIFQLDATSVTPAP